MLLLSIIYFVGSNQDNFEFMIYNGLKLKISILFIAAFVFSFSASSKGFLSVKSQTIEDESGKEFLLQGMGLGGWMLQEGYMLRIPGGGSQRQIKAKISDLIGEIGRAHV